MAEEQANVDEETQDNRMPAPKIKHDWYETEVYVTVVILAKNTENIKVVYNDRALSVSAKLPNGSDYSLELDLAHQIVPDQCSHTVMPSKIEIKLKKKEGYRWTVLEGAPETEEIQPIPQEILQAGTQPLKYPSSCKKTKDWNKIEKEIVKQDDEEKDELGALSSLFQQIYGNGSEEVQRAMNKSFQESGGTVLSTNWAEVGKGKVEKKPPDGLEWKSWSG